MVIELKSTNKGVEGFGYIDGIYSLIKICLILFYYYIFRK